jgi:hypothetical protein
MSEHHMSRERPFGRTNDADGSMRKSNQIVGAALAVLIAGSSAAVAQYDRDGRYVPSPMGVPADPYARVVPGYAGTPGRVRGTPIPPPAPPKLRVPEFGSRPAVSTGIPEAGARTFVPLTLALCDEGWSKELGVPRVEFNRRCKRMRFLEQQKKDAED